MHDRKEYMTPSFMLDELVLDIITSSPSVDGGGDVGTDLDEED